MAEYYKMLHVEFRCTPSAMHFTAEVWILIFLFLFLYLRPKDNYK